MKSNDMSNRSIHTCFAANHQRPITSVPLVVRLLRYVNPRTLALVMFVAFAFLHSMHERDARTEKPATRIAHGEVGRSETSQRGETGERVYGLKTREKKSGNKTAANR